MKKIYIMLLITVLILCGCKKESEIPLTGLVAATNINEKSEVLNEYYLLKEDGASSSLLGDYVTNNINGQDIYNTSLMISEIIKLGTHEKSLLSGKVYSFPDISKVYASDFNYIWDIDKISTLENSDLKVFLSDLASSYYKISTHKNYLDVDIDYDRLSKIENLSDELKLYISINQSKRKVLLDASIKGEFDYNILRDTIIELESFLLSYPDSELIFEAENLYRNLISMFFIGSDGLDPFDYENKKFKVSFYDTLIDTSINFPMTMFSDISVDFLNQIENKNEYMNVDYVSLISNYRKMGLQNKNTITSTISEKSDNSNVLYPQFSYFDDKELESKMNDIIAINIEEIKKELKWKHNSDTKYTISYFVNYGSYKYLSLQLTGSSYNRIDKSNDTIQRNLNFNINTGELIELSDIFNLEFDDYNETLSALIKESGDIPSTKLKSFDSLSEEASFMLSNQSIVLYFEKGMYGFDEKYPTYVYISYSDLKNFFNFRSLYK